MHVSLSTDSPLSTTADVLALGLTPKQLARDPLLGKLDRALGGTLQAAIKQEEFKAKLGQTLGLVGRGRLKAKRLLLVGLGDDATSAHARRLMAVKAARDCSRRGAVLALHAGSAGPDLLSVLAEGAVSGAYRYSRYLTGDRKPKHGVRRVSVLIDRRIDAAARAAVAAGNKLGAAVNLARDLVNCPPNDLTPTALANAAAEECKRAGIACRVYDKKGVEKLGMPLLLAVNRGSHEEPRFVHMTYKPKGTPAARVAFVGKGLTFDSGGLCLKSADGMLDMKMDMAGAATTLAIVIAAAELELPVEVHGILGCTDNMSGGNAYRPGDVYPSRDGKTVEIINTDAEGRLVLADALAYACELKPDYLVDHATLTGACMVALGSYRAGFFSNDDGLREHYLGAAQTSGENYWHMPLDEELRDQLKSAIADVKHTGSRYGGSITAALFLREFVGKARWAHVDIAGPAYLSDVHGVAPKGGTGFGVITAVELLRRLANGS